MTFRENDVASIKVKYFTKHLVKFHEKMFSVYEPSSDQVNEQNSDADPGCDWRRFPLFDWYLDFFD